MDGKYLQRVKEIVEINELGYLNEDDIWEMLDISRAIILDGHFELLSKRHTDTFFRFAAISQYPYLMAKISKELVSWLKKDNRIPKIDVVLGPVSQGMFFAYDIARELNGAMGCRAAYATIDHDGVPQNSLVEGFEIKPGEKVLLVNDMTTTGSGLEKLVNLVEGKCKAEIVSICLFADRGLEEERVKLLKDSYKHFHSILNLNMPSWAKDQCQQKCNSDRMLIHSGSLNHLPMYTEENAYERYVAKLKAA